MSDCDDCQQKTDIIDDQTTAIQQLRDEVEDWKRRYEKLAEAAEKTFAAADAMDDLL